MAVDAPRSHDFASVRASCSRSNSSRAAARGIALAISNMAGLEVLADMLGRFGKSSGAGSAVSPLSTDDFAIRPYESMVRV